MPSSFAEAPTSPVVVGLPTCRSEVLGLFSNDEINRSSFRTEGGSHVQTVAASSAGSARTRGRGARPRSGRGTITADKAVYKQGDTVTLSYSVGGKVPHGGQPAIYLACYFNGGYDYAYWNATDYPTDPRFSGSPTLPSGTVTWKAVIRSTYRGTADCYADLFIDTPQHHYYKLAEAEFDVDS